MSVVMTFNGMASSDDSFGINSITNIKRNILTSTRDRLITVPGRAGVYDLGYDYSERMIEVDLVVRGSSASDLLTKARSIADWLNVSEAKALTFDDESTKQYNARPVGGVDIDQIVDLGKSSITFLCPSPYAEKTSASTVEAVFGTNSGTVSCPCTITLSASAGANVKVENDQTAEYVLITDTFSGGEAVVINTETHAVTIDGSDARSKVDVDSIFFELLPGNWDLILTGCSITSVVYTERFI
jgi:predicted phage tail component-like protein